MSDYFGAATLEDWLAEEVFNIDNQVPPEVVSLFEKWREGIEADIESWMDSDDGDGCRSWRGWGRGFSSISEKDNKEFELAVIRGKDIITRN